MQNIEVTDVRKDLDINIRRDIDDYVRYHMSRRGINDMESEEFSVLVGDIKDSINNKIQEYYSFIGTVNIDICAKTVMDICRCTSH